MSLSIVQPITDHIILNKKAQDFAHARGYEVGGEAEEDGAVADGTISRFLHVLFPLLLVHRPTSSLQLLSLFWN